MRKHYVLITPLLLCGLILGGVAAQASQGRKQSGSTNMSSSTVSEPKGEQVQTQDFTQDQDQKKTQDRVRERTHHNEETPCFTAQDGNTYLWQRRFNWKIHRFEEEGDEEAKYKYLEKIANRYTFEHNSGVDDFVHWAIQNRPWDTE